MDLPDKGVFKHAHCTQLISIQLTVKLLAPVGWTFVQLGQSLLKGLNIYVTDFYLIIIILLKSRDDYFV